MRKNMYERYCELRDLKGYKDADIYRITGVAKSTLSDWKNGKSKPKQDKLIPIAKCLGVSVNYLITGKESEYSIEAAETDVSLSNMNKRMKEYALKMSELSNENQELIMQMIDKLGESRK